MGSNAVGALFRRRLENIGGYQDHGVSAVVAVPVHGGPGFSGGVTGFEGLRSAIVANDRVRSLQEINHGRTILVIVQADVTARLDRQQPQAELPSG
jgi:hypothetical protein